MKALAKLVVNTPFSNGANDHEFSYATFVAEVEIILFNTCLLLPQYTAEFNSDFFFFF